MFPRLKTLSPTEASGALARGELQLVDVRDARELAEVRVEGARHIPLGQLGWSMGELDRGRPLAFICRSGGRSALATRAAADAGLDAANVSGGIEAWVRDGLPVRAKRAA